ncbi:MAG: hypothetical protein WCA12_16905 [Burkholderiales bacterium]
MREFRTLAVATLWIESLERFRLLRDGTILGREDSVDELMHGSVTHVGDHVDRLRAAA